jgi:hypothetical protein
MHVIVTVVYVLHNSYKGLSTFGSLRPPVVDPRHHGANWPYVCLSLSMKKLQNRWKDFDAIWKNLMPLEYTIYHSTLQFPTIDITKMADEVTCEVGLTIAPPKYKAL